MELVEDGILYHSGSRDMGVGMNVSQSRSHGLGGFTGSIIRGKMDLAMMG